MPLGRVCGQSVQREAKRGLLARRLLPRARVHHLRFALVERGANFWLLHFAMGLRQANVMG